MSSRSSFAVEHETETSKMTLNELRQEYVTLKMNAYDLTERDNEINKMIETLRAKSVNFQLYSETQEECITNRCIRTLDDEKNNARQWNESLAEKERELRKLKQEIEKKRSSQNGLEKRIREKKEYQLRELNEKLVSVNDRHNKLQALLLQERQRYLTTLMQILANIKRRYATDIAAATLVVAETIAKAPLHISISDEAANINVDEVQSPISDDMSVHTLSNNNIINNKNNCADNADVVECAISATQAITDTHSPLPSSLYIKENIHIVEERLNKLITEHEECVRKFVEERKEYDELVQKLKEEDQAYTLLRNKAAKREEDLLNEQRKLEELNTSGLVNSSFGDSSFCTTPNRSFDPNLFSTFGCSLRERTRELLSTPLPQTTPSERVDQ